MSEDQALFSTTIPPRLALVNAVPFSQSEMVDKVFLPLVDDMQKLREGKGSEYAGNADCLANFRRNAGALGVSAELCLMVYAGKHWDSIQSYVKALETRQPHKTSEDMKGRIADLMNYMVLLAAMLYENNRGVK